MIIKLARFQVRKESLPEALKAVLSFVDEVQRKEGGTARYDAYQHKDDPTRFTHHMAFRTPSAEEYHKRTQWCKRFVDTVYPMCVEPPVFEEVEQLDPAAGR